MKYFSPEDVQRNLHHTVFYHPKLKKAYLLLQEEGLNMIPFAATPEGFTKRLPGFRADIEFHLTTLESGFAPRLFCNKLVYAKRRPFRQWRVGWTPHNSNVGFVEIYEQEQVGLSCLGLDGGWQTREGFVGDVWTGGYRTFKGVLQDGKGALTPHLALLYGNLINQVDVIGYLKKDNSIALKPEYHTSFIVRELKDCGVINVTQLEAEEVRG